MDRNQVEIKGIAVLVMIICSILFSAFALSVLTQRHKYTYELKTFSSYDELGSYLKNAIYGRSGYYDISGMLGVSPGLMKSLSAEDSEGSNGISIDYSQTNIQVEGVDEPDIVKTDGTYLYIISNQSVFIALAYPAEDAHVLSKITLESDVTPQNIFINGDRLVLFGNSYRMPVETNYSEYWWDGVTTAVIIVYDISDHTSPELVRNIEIDGGYFDSRMIGDYVYVITSEYTYTIYCALSDGNYSLNIPEITIDDETEKIPADQIYYVDIPEPADTMTHVIAFDVNDDSGDVSQKSFLLGDAQTMYVSGENIYLACTQYSYYPLLLGSGVSSSDQEKTILHRISIDAGDVSYAAQGEVPGHILDQFSMDEHDGYFRIATTVGYAWNANSSENSVYILDMDLKRVSEIEDIAPGEQIHSARFMGDKAYLVTFKKIDPFFTIDLSDPYNPQIIGELKIPGYSDYLHPYDETHIIGVGKETVDPLESEEWMGKDFAWYQGLKLALFDVSDFENPVEVSKIVIGDRGTDSPVLYDHKAFLFDREKELLVIPVSLYEIPAEIKEQQDGYTGSIYGEFTFQGAYVYRLTLENGFEYRGRITHLTDEDVLKTWESWYWGYSFSDIFRSLYIENVLYTISTNMVKMNNLEDLSEINSVDLV